MTTEELVTYYADLLILQYLGKPRAYATIKALVRPAIIDQLPLTVQDAFNLSTAEGVQLDVIGKYVGVIRTGYGTMGAIILDDGDFYQLIKMAIIKNSAGSSLATIQNLLHAYFPGTIFVFDYQNMHMSYYLSASVGSQDLAQMFINQDLLPAPMGVQISSVIYAPVIDSFFGFGSYEIPAMNSSPFNTYTSYDMSSPWLAYENAIII